MGFCSHFRIKRVEIFFQLIIKKIKQKGRRIYNMAELHEYRQIQREQSRYVNTLLDPLNLSINTFTHGLYLNFPR